MVKKKILAFAMVFALAAVAVVGGSLAYFTDEDEAENTFAVGNVNISLIEQQRNEQNPDMLSPYVDGSTLIPVVENEKESPVITNGDNDETNDVALPSEANYANYIDKIVRVSNTGKSQAYVRAFIAIPSSIDAFTLDGGLHLSLGESKSWEDLIPAGTATINSIKYNVYSRINSEVVESWTTTAPAYSGIYLDKDVDADENGNLIINGNAVGRSTYTVEGKVVIPVFAQAIQVAGFDTADEAFDASGLTSNPWAE